MLHRGQPDCVLPGTRRRDSMPLRPRIARLLLLAFSLSLGLGARAAESPQEDWIQVLRDDDAGMDLLLQAPELEQRDRAWFVPGFDWAGEPGAPILFEKAALIAVPGGDGADLEIVGAESEALSGGVAPRIPATPQTDPTTGMPTQSPLPPQLRPSWTEPVAPSPVALVAGGRLRGRDVVTLQFTPLRLDPQGGGTYTRSLRVRVRFRGRPAFQEGPATADPLHASLLNGATAGRWQGTWGVQKSARSAAAAQLPSRRVRVRIATTGLYALDYETLRGLLADEVDTLDPTTLQLYVDAWEPIPLNADSTPASWQVDYAPREVPILVEGEGNRFLDPGDRVVFYGVGPKDYVDLLGFAADSLLHAQGPYDRTNTAWLVWGVQPGLRMQSLPSGVTGEPPDLVTRNWVRVHFEEDREFDTADDLWIWEELRSNNPASVRFDVDLAGEQNVDARMRLGIGAADYSVNGNHAVDVRLNGSVLGQIRWTQPVSKPPNHYVSFPVTLEESNLLRLALANLPTLTSDRTLFLKFDLTWERPLALPVRGSETGRLRWSRRAVTTDEAFEITGFAQEPWILDVTEPLRPVRRTQPSPAAPGRWRFRGGRGAGAMAHHLAVPSPTPLRAPDVVLRNLAPLRQPSSMPDMLIITESSLLQPAQRLAVHRASHFPASATLGHAPNVQVVDVADIYDNFSGGRVDPLAIRNYLKFLYTQPLEPGEDAPRLQYVLLFGEATHDPQRRLPGSTPTLVPTVHAWYADALSAGLPQQAPQHLRRWYAVEDWIGEMEAPRAAGFSNVHPLPDLGVGRLTPRTAAEAQRLVDKLIDYDTSTDFDAWRTRVILSADDECKLGDCRETEHVRGMEALIPWTPPEWDIVKIYLTEYPAVLGQKPLGRAAFIRAWSEGCALVTYQGHGAPRQLADEVLFLSTDIPSLTNGRRLPVFMAYSCTVAEFDAPELQTMCEDLVSHGGGGAVAAVGATVLTFASPNIDYNIAVWKTMFEAGAVAKVPFGIIHQLSKNRSPSLSGQNNEKYVLLGDPAMTLLSPEALVTFGGGADSLEAGRSTEVEGIVHAAGDRTPLVGFNGVADVEVRGTADDSGYQSQVPPFVRIDYDLPGPPLYRGRVQVQNGALRFRFVVPLGTRLGEKARISGYAFDAAAGLDAKGASNQVRVVRAAQPDSSLGPPRIHLFFPNNLTKVKAGTPLTAEIRDENGINIQGTTLPSSILLDFDDQNQPLNVTAQFRYADGSDSVGTVEVPLPEGLEAGPHKATLIASDNLQNRSSASLGFDVVPSTATLMANVIAFPNPFKDRTFFFFELTDPADVSVRVFTVSGREVWHTRQSVDVPQQVSIRWDGVDFARDALANGTYLYRVEARPRTGGSAPLLKHVGKVVIMRD